jgi:hypothetical protein
MPETHDGAGIHPTMPHNTELTIEEAAKVLGLPTSLVRRRIDTGLPPVRGVGADRRLRLAAALALRAREADQDAAIAELAANIEDLERKYGL